MCGIFGQMQMMEIVMMGYDFLRVFGVKSWRMG
jgi:hypothetical protein